MFVAVAPIVNQMNEYLNESWPICFRQTSAMSSFHKAIRPLLRSTSSHVSQSSRKVSQQILQNNSQVGGDIVGSGAELCESRAQEQIDPVVAKENDAKLPGQLPFRIVTSPDGVALETRPPELKIDTEPIESSFDGASQLPEVRRMWFNVPHFVADSMRTSHIKSLDEIERPKEFLQNSPIKAKTQAVVDGCRTALSVIGLCNPPSRHLAAPDYENIQIAPYQNGQTAAYYWPNQLLPVEMCRRFPAQELFDPVYQTTDQRFLWQTKPSGQPLSGLWTGVEQWRKFVVQPLLEKHGDHGQFLRLHMDSHPISRRTHQLTKYILRNQMEHKEQFKSFVHRGKWTPELKKTLHLHTKELPTILLVDRRGYIRWHATGLPTKEAAEVAFNAARKLSTCNHLKGRHA